MLGGQGEYNNILVKEKNGMGDVNLHQYFPLKYKRVLFLLILLILQIHLFVGLQMKLQTGVFPFKCLTLYSFIDRERTSI